MTTPVLCLELVVAVVCLLLAPGPTLPWIALGLFLVAAVVAVSSSRHLRSPVVTPRGGGEWGTPGRGPTEVVDLTAPDGTFVGCLGRGPVVVTALSVRSGTTAATVIDAAGPGPHTGARLPLTVLTELARQEDIRLDGIDVVVSGTRSTPGAAGAGYDRLVGRLPVISHRETTVLLRFDLGRGGRSATARGADTEATARTVVAGTLRVRRALAHHGFGCRQLDATGLAEVHRRLSDAAVDHAAVLPVAELAEGAAERCWAVPAAAITEVYSLRSGRSRREPALISVAVEFRGTSAEPEVIRGAPVVRRAVPAPGGPRRPVDRRTWALARPDLVEHIAPPAHGVGQIVGAVGQGAVALALAGVHLRTVLLAGDRGVCTALLLRAAATGVRIRVHTDSPAAWDRLVAAVDDPARMAVREREDATGPMADTGAAEVDLLVWDSAVDLDDARLDALADPGPDTVPPTVVVLVSTDAEGRHPGFDETLRRGPELVLDARVAGWISVEPRDGPRVQARVVGVPQEEELLHRTPLRPDRMDSLTR